MRTPLPALACLAALALPAPAFAAQPAEPPSAEDLLDRSIAYHDPGGVWGERAVRLVVRSELSEELAAERGVPGTTRRAVIDPAAGRFTVSFEKEGAVVEMAVDGEEATVTVDGRSGLSGEELERSGAVPPGPFALRDYLSFLYGLPMKLRDPGTRLDPEAERTVFAERDVWALRVTYDEAVGSDTWYVYLDPQTAALVGYRFYHDEAAGDGEWIVVEGEAEDEGLRLPRVRRWYTNAGDTYLATDTLEELEVLAPEEAEAAAAAPAPEPLWATEIGLSYVATTGNTETTTFGSSFDAERRPVPWGVHLFASYDRSEDRDVLRSERAYGGVRGTRALGERWELFAEATGEQDEFAGFELRTVVASGATLHALLGPRHLLDLDLGATWTDVDRVAPAGDESFLGALAGLTYEWKVSERSAFKQRLVVYPNFETSSDWRLESFTTLESALNSWLALRFAHELRFQNEPVGDRDDTDTTTRAALVVTF